MTCYHCGLDYQQGGPCPRCGAVQGYAPPPDFYLDQSSGWYYKVETALGPGGQPVQRYTYFDTSTGQYSQADYPAPQQGYGQQPGGYVPESLAPSPARAGKGFLVACVALFAVSFAVTGFLLGIHRVLF